MPVGSTARELIFSALQHKKLAMLQRSIHSAVMRMALAAETSLIDLFLPLR
jgi:hypothetical protein